MDQSPNWQQQQQRGGGRGNNWYSPQYNNRSPGGGGYSQWQSSPRHSNYNKNWRGSPYRTQSPYRYNRARHSSNYSPRPQFYTSFDSDTGAEGQQESPHKQTPKSSYGNAGADDIEQWVNPGMWQDPWARLMPIPQTTSTNETNDISIAVSNPHADAISSLTNLETKEDPPPPESDANTSKGQGEDVVHNADEDIEDS